MMVVNSTTKPIVYVSTLWCYHLYQCCQYFFEDIDEIEFANLLNLRCAENSIFMRSKEKYRFCYFLHVLAEEKRFTKSIRDFWLTEILKATSIKQNYYKSHYSDPIRNDFADLRDNKIIVSELAEAISKARGKTSNHT